MKNYLKIFMLMAFLLVGSNLFAVNLQDAAELVTSEQIVLWLTPFAVLLGTYVVRLVKPSIPGWATMIVVSALSTGVAWITNLVVGGDTSFLIKVGIGLGAVILNQMYRQFTGGNSAAKKAK